MPLTIQLPSQQEQLAFNCKRWTEVLQDRFLASINYRIETDRHGHLIMSPPASRKHSLLQSEITILLSKHLSNGLTSIESPISTEDGVRVADGAWISKERNETIEADLFTIAPEICVEVVSPGNAQAEMAERKALYFEAGAKEVWFCTLEGEMTFYFLEAIETPQPKSTLCPDFVTQVVL